MAALRFGRAIRQRRESRRRSRSRSRSLSRSRSQSGERNRIAAVAPTPSSPHHQQQQQRTTMAPATLRHHSSVPPVPSVSARTVANARDFEHELLASSVPEEDVLVRVANAAAGCIGMRDALVVTRVAEMTIGWLSKSPPPQTSGGGAVPASETVVAAGLRVIRELSYAPPDHHPGKKNCWRLARLVALGCIGAIASAMSRHKTSPLVQLRGLEAVVNVTGHGGDVSGAGCIEATCGAMRAFPDDPEIQLAALWALDHMTCRGREVEKLCVWAHHRCGVHALVCSAIETHGHGRKSLLPARSGSPFFLPALPMEEHHPGGDGHDDERPIPIITLVGLRIIRNLCTAHMVAMPSPDNPEQLTVLQMADGPADERRNAMMAVNAHMIVIATLRLAAKDSGGGGGGDDDGDRGTRRRIARRNSPKASRKEDKEEEDGGAEEGGGEKGKESCGGNNDRAPERGFIERNEEAADVVGCGGVGILDVVGVAISVARRLCSSGALGDAEERREAMVAARAHWHIFSWTKTCAALTLDACRTMHCSPDDPLGARRLLLLLQTLADSAGAVASLASCLDDSDAGAQRLALLLQSGAHLMAVTVLNVAAHAFTTCASVRVRERALRAITQSLSVLNVLTSGGDVVSSAFAGCCSPRDSVAAADGLAAVSATVSLLQRRFIQLMYRQGTELQRALAEGVGEEAGLDEVAALFVALRLALRVLQDLCHGSEQRRDAAVAVGVIPALQGVLTSPASCGQDAETASAAAAVVRNLCFGATLAAERRREAVAAARGLVKGVVENVLNRHVGSLACCEEGAWAVVNCVAGSRARRDRAIEAGAAAAMKRAGVAQHAAADDSGASAWAAWRRKSSSQF